MYPLFDFKENIKNIYILCKPFIPSKEINLNQLKHGYIGFLNKYHTKCPTPEKNVSSWQFVEESNLTLMKVLYERFNESSPLDDHISELDLKRPKEEDIIIFKKTITEAYEFIAEKNPEATHLFDLVINYIILGSAGEGGGGTSTNALGAIWHGLKSGWSKQDICEFLIHEMTHMLIFIDEHRVKQFHSLDALASKSNWGLTALFARKRPLDKGFHSVIVATNILLCRESFLGHLKGKALHLDSHLLAKQTIASAEDILSIQNISSLLTDHSLQLLQKCKNTVETMINEGSLNSSFQSLKTA